MVDLFSARCIEDHAISLLQVSSCLCLGLSNDKRVYAVGGAISFGVRTFSVAPALSLLLTYSASCAQVTYDLD